MTDQQIPHDEQAESAIIGAIFLDPSLIWEVAHIVEQNDFYVVFNRYMWEAIMNLANRGIDPDQITVRDELNRLGYLQKIGGPAEIVKYISATYTTLNLKYHAEKVKQCSIRRSMLKIASDTAKLAYDQNEEPEESVGHVMTELSKIASTKGDPIIHIGDALEDLQSEIEHRAEHPDEPIGVKTGLIDLDRLMGAWEPGYYMLAGKPKLGKSKLANQIVVGWAKDEQPGVIFSLEMKQRLITRRIVSAHIQLDTYKLKTATLADEEWAEFVQGVGELSKYPLWLDTTPGLTPDQLRARAAHMKAKRGIKWILLDYLLLMGGKPKNMDEIQWSGYLSTQMKTIFDELDLIGFVVNSTTKENMSVKSPVPSFATSRGSGQIAHDVDVMLIMTEDMDTPPNPQIRELHLVGGRDIPSGRVKIIAQQGFPTFHNVEAHLQFDPSEPPMFPWQEYIR